MGTFAVIDVGTNSMKMHVARVDDGVAVVLGDVTEVTRLGEGLHEAGELGAGAIARNLEALSRFRDEAVRLGAEHAAVVGTMALREAANSGSFTEAARERCGLEVEIISGEEEARLSYLAVRSGLRPGRGRLLVFDTGGGSTELILGEGDAVIGMRSLPLGARGLTEEFCKSDPVTIEEVAALASFLETRIEVFDDEVDTLVGMGGTVTSMAAVAQGMASYAPDAIEGYRLDAGEIRRQLELYRSLKVARRSDVKGLLSARADVMLAGAAIVREIMRKVGAEALTVTDRGLRHGLFHDRFVRRNLPGRASD